MTRPWHLPALLFCLVLGGGGVAACGNDGSTTTSPVKPALCQDVDAIQASAEKMKEAKIGDNALPVLSTELKRIQTRVQQIPSDAATQYSTEIDALKAADASLSSSVTAASQAPTAAAMSAVATDLKAVGTAVRGLNDAVASTC